MRIVSESLICAPIYYKVETVLGYETSIRA